MTTKNKLPMQQHIILSCAVNFKKITYLRMKMKQELQKKEDTGWTLFIKVEKGIELLNIFCYPINHIFIYIML